MRTLFVFDQSVDVRSAPDLARAVGEGVVLFPLTGNRRLIERVAAGLWQDGVSPVEVLETARLIDAEVDALCADFPRWSAGRGELRVGGKSVREWFLMPGGGVSGFWFGALSEKNPLKSGLFLLLVQAFAAERELERGKYSRLAVAVAPDLLAKALRGMAAAAGLPFREGRGGRKKLTGRLRRSALGETAAALAGWGQAVARGWRARRAMGRLEGRLPGAGSLRFASYFPYLDDEAASRGRFRNKYFEPLQRLCEERGRETSWLLIFVYIDGGSYGEALRLARRFADRGEKVSFLDEYFGPREAMGALAAWARQALRYLILGWRAGTAALCVGLGSPAARPIVRSLWLSSFCGLGAMRGICAYLAFRRALRSAPAGGPWVYCCEMQAWEKAFNAAASLAQPGAETVGFIHTSISRNYMFFRHTPREIASSGRPGGLPLPRVLAANGAIARELLADLGYSGVVEVEALRQLPLARAMAQRPSGVRREPHVLLVAGSIIEEESLALLSMAFDAGPLRGVWEVWLKGHPSMPLAPLLGRLGIEASSAGWRVQEGDIHPCLERASVVLVATSTVAIDALAFGCEVVTPALSSVFSMNLLRGFERYCHRISSPTELKARLEAYAQNGPSVPPGEKTSFVKRYWNLDAGLPAWAGLLKL